MFIPASSLHARSRFDTEEWYAPMRAAFLVIDDLGSEHASESGYFEALLDEVIAWRHEAMTPTCLTTNLKAQAFKSRYGERITDRIRGDGLFYEVAATSMRSKP